MALCFWLKTGGGLAVKVVTYTVFLVRAFTIAVGAAALGLLVVGDLLPNTYRFESQLVTMGFIGTTAAWLLHNMETHEAWYVQVPSFVLAAALCGVGVVMFYAVAVKVGDPGTFEACREPELGTCSGVFAVVLVMAMVVGFFGGALTSPATSRKHS